MAQKKYDESIINKALQLADEVGAKNAADQLGISCSAIYYHTKKRKEDEQRLQKEMNLTEKDEIKLRKLISPLNPAEEVESNENISFQKAEKEYRRGDVYFIHKFSTTGAEMVTGRPAIIVSNDRINSKLGTVEVVFLSTKNRVIAPEHFNTKITGVLSMVVCEQVTAVDKARVGDFIGTCTPDDIKMLDKALLASLGLEKYSKSDTDDQILSRIATIKAERDAYKNIYDELFNRMMQANK